MHPGVMLLDCAAAISRLDAPPADLQDVGGIYLDVNHVVQANRSGRAPSAYEYVAKSALVVPTDQAFELEVFSPSGQMAAVGWGSGPGSVDFPTTQLRSSGCPATRAEPEWLVFAGGYYVTAPSCVPLVVTTGELTRAVHISVGVPCTGERAAGGDPPATRST